MPPDNDLFEIPVFLRRSKTPEAPSEVSLIQGIVSSLRDALPGEKERTEFDPLSDDELHVRVVLFAARIICRKLVSIGAPFETMPPLHRNEEKSAAMRWIANTVSNQMVKPIMRHPVSEWDKYRILGLVNTALAPHIERAASRKRPYI